MHATYLHIIYIYNAAVNNNLKTSNFPLVFCIMLMVIIGLISAVCWSIKRVNDRIAVDSGWQSEVWAHTFHSHKGLFKLTAIRWTNYGQRLFPLKYYTKMTTFSHCADEHIVFVRYNVNWSRWNYFFSCGPIIPRTPVWFVGANE